MSKKYIIYTDTPYEDEEFVPLYSFESMQELKDKLLHIDYLPISYLPISFYENEDEFAVQVILMSRAEELGIIECSENEEINENSKDDNSIDDDYFPF